MFDICGTTYELYGRVGDVVTGDSGCLTILNTKQYTEYTKNKITGADVTRSQGLREMLGVAECQFDAPGGAVTIKRDVTVWKEEVEPKLRKFCEYVHSKLGKPT